MLPGAPEPGLRIAGGSDHDDDSRWDVFVTAVLAVGPAQKRRSGYGDKPLSVFCVADGAALPRGLSYLTRPQACLLWSQSASAGITAGGSDDKAEAGQSVVVQVAPPNFTVISAPGGGPFR
jgi:hypothetical protein